MGSLPSPNIPTLDFSPYDNNSPEGRLELAKSLITAFRTTGFVTLTNHGLPPSLLSTALQTSRQLFALSLEQKLLAPHPPGPEVHRGYSQPGLEKVSQYYGGDEDVGKKLREVVDCKESYEIGSEGNPEQPNVWLPEHVFPGFRDFTTEFYWRCHSLSQKILHLIALGLELPDPDFFLKYHSGQNNQLRLLHYPPIPAREIEEDRAARISAHTDWGTITLLFQDDCGGLEIEDPNSEGNFVPVTPVEGACVVNVGDLLMRWTNGTFLPFLPSPRLVALFTDFLLPHRSLEIHPPPRHASPAIGSIRGQGKDDQGAVFDPVFRVCGFGCVGGELVCVCG